jgi:DnaK suppressor protein
LSEAGPAAGEVTDRKDFAADSALANIAEEVEDLELEEQALVEAALRRLDQGGYGDCQDCGEPIALARLKVQPAAGRCAACQAVHEGALEHRAPRHPR